VQLATLLLQIVAILVAAGLFDRLFRRLRQPQVIGEMAAGLVLGPSLLGWPAPGISASLFPTASLGYLNALSQVGLVLFMLLVGLELCPTVLRHLGRVAVTTSCASIVVSFVLGDGLAVGLHLRLTDGQVPLAHFALFAGTAMSVTASSWSSSTLDSTSALSRRRYSRCWS